MRAYGIQCKGYFYPEKTTGINNQEWAINSVGRLLYDEDALALYFGGGSRYTKITSKFDLINENQRLIFASSPLPDGWNVDTSVSDMIILLTDTDSEIGDTGGDWEIIGMVAAGDHNHLCPDDAYNINMSVTNNHANWGLYYYYPHGYWTVENPPVDFYFINMPGAKKNHLHWLEDAGDHTHDFSSDWRPPYAQMIVGVFTG